MVRSNRHQKRGVSPPPSYSVSDPAAGSSFGPPPPYNANPAAAPGRNERTPLFVRPIIIDTSTHIILPPTRDRLITILVLFATIAFLASIIWLQGLPFFSPRIPTLPAPPPVYNVAIIGAGPAGIAAAQYLRCSPVARDVQFNITMFESRPVIGGMLAVHDSDGRPVFPNDDPMQSHITAEDIAGNALMWQNALFTRDSENLLRDKIGFTELGVEQVGYYNTRLTVASTVRPYSKVPLTTWVWLLWAYGGSLHRAARFNRDGDLRERMLEAPITTDAEKIFNSLGVLEHLQQWAGTLLEKRGISERYATEILDPQVQRAFGQRRDHLTGFAAMLAAAQEDSANAYMGGHMIERLEHIVRAIDVPVRTSTRVVGIHYDWQGNQWGVQHKSAKGGGEISTEAFDKVILSAVDLGIRLESSDGGVYNLSSFHEPDENDEMEDAEFIPVHITFFTSNAKLSSLRNHDQVLFQNGVGGTQEITLVRETTSNTGTQYLYRVLSQSSVLKDLMHHYDVLWSYETRIANWQPVRFPLFRMPIFEWPVARGLWWSSTIQHAWSTVDLNWLAGKVVADDLIKEVLGRK